MKPLVVAVVAVLLALLLPAVAAAHVDVRPTLVSSGEEVVLRIELPALRPGQDPRSLAVDGPGVELLSSDRSSRAGSESRWRVRIRVSTEPGPLPLVLVAGYADGESVTVRQTLTVIPASGEEASGTPLLAIVVALASLLLMLAAILLLRRSRTRR